MSAWRALRSDHQMLLTPSAADLLPDQNEDESLVKRKRRRSPQKSDLNNILGEKISSEALKYGSLVLLVLQNSSVFVVTRYSRIGKHRPYLASVVVLLVEIIKFVLCLALILRDSHYSPRSMLLALRRHVFYEWRTTLLLGIPAACYALQNNLIFVAIGNLSAAAAQVLYQLKTLSTAFFTVIILSKRFSWPQWLSFILLTLGVLLVQSEDAKSSSAPTGAAPLVGAAAAISASALSGFAGVFLEMMYTNVPSSATSSPDAKSTSSNSPTRSSSSNAPATLWTRNVQLSLFTLPLQFIAIHASGDFEAIDRHGWLQGFRFSTWLVVALQVGGALLIAVVIKFAGNVLKTFASVVALLLTCGWSMALFDFHPTALFAAGVGTVALSIYLYSRPEEVIDGLDWAYAVTITAYCDTIIVEEEGEETPRERTLPDGSTLPAVDEEEAG